MGADGIGDTNRDTRVGENVVEATPSSGDSGPCCAPGCSCGSPSGGKGIKIAVSALVLAIVGGILVYKVVVGKPQVSQGVSVQGGLAGPCCPPAAAAAGTPCGPCP